MYIADLSALGIFPEIFHQLCREKHSFRQIIANVLVQRGIKKKRGIKSDRLEYRLEPDFLGSCFSFAISNLCQEVTKLV